MSITHKKVSAIIEGIDPSLVRPSDWNDSHEIKEAGGQALTVGSILDLTILKRSGTVCLLYTSPSPRD